MSRQHRRCFLARAPALDANAIGRVLLCTRSSPRVSPSASPSATAAGAGFFLGYENDTLPENIGKWHVKPLYVSRTKRYLDAGVANAFWADVDAHIFAKKPYLLKRPSSSSGSSVASGGSGSSGGSGARA